MPGLAVADRDDIDMAIEDQRALTLLTEQPSDEHGLCPLHFHSGKPWMGFEPAHVGFEPVDLEAGFFEHEGDEVLHGAFVAGHRWDPDEILGQLDAGVGVQRLERDGFCLLLDHGVSLKRAKRCASYKCGSCCWPK